jgi:methyltransferase (TIGR00027 family)
MARTDHDTWDLGSGVGSTATMVAAARAVASGWPDSFADDHFAAALVRSVGIDVFTRLASGELSFADIGGDGGSAWMPYLFGIRTNHFDRFWTSVVADGFRQVVNLASGLDSRGYRLPCPAGTIAYEIDRPEVIEFKQAVLADLGAEAKVEIQAVGVDLRDDWPAALRAAGFDPATPTAWIAEGLMIGFLPGDAQDRLLDDVTRLSATGSRLAADHVPGSYAVLGDQMRRIGESWLAQGLDADFANLYYAGEHHNAETYLQERGWETTGAVDTDLFAAAGLAKPAVEFGAGVEGVVYVTATRR